MDWDVRCCCALLVSVSFASELRDSCMNPPETGFIMNAATEAWHP